MGRCGIRQLEEAGLQGAGRLMPVVNHDFPE